MRQRIHITVLSYAPPLARAGLAQGALAAWCLAFCLTLALCLTMAVPAQAQGGPQASDAFVGGFEDLPLMPGLVQDPGAVTVFDSPYGRVSQATASGRVTAQAVRAFYTATLPQLGWTQVDETTFRREGQQLGIDITADGPELTVRFHASPSGG